MTTATNAKKAVRHAKPENRKAPPRNAQLRAEFGLTRKMLARLTGLSERTVATWEAGGELNEANSRSVTTAQRFLRRLAEVVRKKAIAAWLDTPNDGFDGLKPVEVIERGEIDRLWDMIYFLGSGAAS
jgi:DNA-binding XRE family transcriptional regulator